MATNYGEIGCANGRCRSCLWAMRRPRLAYDNDVLSAQRAAKVQHAMITEGVNTNRISIAA